MSSPGIQPNSPFAYDIFLSHSSRNKDRARRLATRLTRCGLRVWFDEWAIAPGDLIGLQVERGLQQSRVLVLLMSREAFESEWVALERHTALFRDPTSRERRFVPVRLDDAELPDMLRQFAYVDFRQESDRALEEIVEVCHPPRLERDPSPSEKPIRTVIRTKVGMVLGIDFNDSSNRWVCGGTSGRIEVGDLSSGSPAHQLGGHGSVVVSVAWARDANLLASCSHDGTIRIWDGSTLQCLRKLLGHDGRVLGLALSRDGSIAVSGGSDRTVRVWDVKDGSCRSILLGHAADVVSVALSSKYIISGSRDKDVRCWDLQDGRILTVFRGHTDWVQAVAISPTGDLAISAGMDGTIRAWDLSACREIGHFEGHAGPIEGLAFSGNGRFFASGSHDRTARVWDLKLRRCVSVLKDHSRGVPSVALSHDGDCALVGCADGTIHTWTGFMPLTPWNDGESAPYVNAKVLVVGESGAGKTALTIRLATNQFESTVSSDGVWAVQVPLPNARTDHGEREVWLWDFAGQADYRPIHQLFMDDTALVIVVFNPQVHNPLDQLMEWDSILTSLSKQPRKLLVSSRGDRGGLTDNSIEEFARDHGYDGYYPTSALLGTGIEDLRNEIQASIRWAEIPWTTTTRRFRLLKLAILNLRQRGKHLMTLVEIKQSLGVTLPREDFDAEEIRAALKLLVGPGVVWQVGFGDLYLMIPEVLNQYAAALFREVRKRSMAGCILEQHLLLGRLDYQDLARLTNPEEELLLRALCEASIRNGLCIRDNSADGPQLIFPFLHMGDKAAAESDLPPVIYFPIQGVVESLYSLLAVRLIYSRKFPRYELSRRATTFQTEKGSSIRLELLRDNGQDARIMIRASRDCDPQPLAALVQYVNITIQPYMQGASALRCVTCHECGNPVKDSQAVAFRLKSGKATIPCLFCDVSVPLKNELDQLLEDRSTTESVGIMSAAAEYQMERQTEAVLFIGHIRMVALELGASLAYTKRDDLFADALLRLTGSGPQGDIEVWVQLNPGALYARRQELDSPDEFVFLSSELGRKLRASAERVAVVYLAADRSIYWKPLWRGCILEEQHSFSSFSYSFLGGEKLSSLSLRRAVDLSVS